MELKQILILADNDLTRNKLAYTWKGAHLCAGIGVTLNARIKNTRTPFGIDFSCLGVPKNYSIDKSRVQLYNLA